MMSLSRWSDAKRLLRRGIDRNAQPLARLESLIQSVDTQINVSDHQHLPHQQNHHHRYVSTGTMTSVDDAQTAVAQPLLLHSSPPPLPDAFPVGQAQWRALFVLFDWTEASLRRACSAAVLRECYREPGQEMSIEEMRYQWQHRCILKKKPDAAASYQKRRIWSLDVTRAHKEKQRTGHSSPAGASQATNAHLVAFLSDGTPAPPDPTQNTKRSSTHLSRSHHLIPLETCIVRDALTHIEDDPACIDHRPRSGLTDRLRLERKARLSFGAIPVRKLGQGAMGKVYLVEGDMACKVVQSTQAVSWEFYIMVQAARRGAAEAIQPALGLHLFQDTGFLLVGYARHGTLLDALNTQRQLNRRMPTLVSLAMPEPLALALVERLVQAVVALHRAQIIHGDLKLDNVVLSLNDLDDGQRWLTLVDFGRSVDLSLLPSPIRLKAAWSPQKTDMPPIQNHASFPPWWVDYWGLADMAHWLLFGKALQIRTRKKRIVLQQPLRRYWQKDLWAPLFDLLLNPAHVGREGQALTDQLEALACTFRDCPVRQEYRERSALLQLKEALSAL